MTWTWQKKNTDHQLVFSSFLTAQDIDLEKTQRDKLKCQYFYLEPQKSSILAIILTLLLTLENCMFSSLFIFYFCPWLFPVRIQSCLPEDLRV